MNVLVVGCGKVGTKLACDLWEEGHDVSIVEKDASLFDNLPASFKGMRVSGVVIDKEVLKEAGIEEADAVAAVYPDDNINILVCQIAKELFHKKNVIARIFDPKRESVFHHFGLETICPTNLTSDHIKALITENQDEEIHTISGTMVSYREKPIGDDHEGIPLSKVEIGDGMMIFAIKNGSDLTFAKPNYILKKGDVFVISEIVD